MKHTFYSITDSYGRFLTFGGKFTYDIELECYRWKTTSDIKLREMLDTLKEDGVAMGSLIISVRTVENVDVAQFLEK